MKLRSRLLVALVSITVFGLTSCTRDYICECEIAYSGRPSLPDTVIKKYDITDTKKNAEALCEDNSGKTEIDGILTVETCKLR